MTERKQTYSGGNPGLHIAAMMIVFLVSEETVTSDMTRTDTSNPLGLDSQPAGQSGNYQNKLKQFKLKNVGVVALQPVDYSCLGPLEGVCFHPGRQSLAGFPQLPACHWCSSTLSPPTHTFLQRSSRITPDLVFV